ncbi:MAG TPA: carboxymuconolactone decarboxylase family protein [Mycobacterium sp.]
MNAVQSGLGGRLALFDPQALSATQRELFDHITGTALPWAQGNGFAATTADRRLIGPFNPSLLSPQIATAFLQLQSVEEHHTCLDERVRQVVILTVGAVWQARYELYAHSAVARHTGLSRTAITELISGEIPDDLNENERTAQQFTRMLSTTHHVDDALYDHIEQIFGAAGVFEITMLTGIYHTVCGILNAFNIPAPGHDA